ncbi:type II secretion system protein GspM [Aquabacterium sp.]|uniref:type II secretion system protein GspM n=1 Tax=Aquabacterium sp. TaxID=1872578 RepID=UPI002C4F8AC3|nr:type II secretion system protein GspM [Aquabacterium sp.]HSW07120.1 type II secretion system protein GspM [Aquabacterium sp.]
MDTADTSAWRSARNTLAAAWAARNARERSMLLLAAAVLGLYLLWALALAPALATVRSAPAKLDALDGQLQQMQRLAAEATELRATPPVPPEQSQVVLSAAAARLGDKAKLTLQGPRATLTVTGMPAEELTAWIAEVRVGARARVIEGQLNRTPQGLYAGNVVLAIGGGP